MKIIGLTGGIGSGKSTVTAMLRQAGYTVIDADEISREVSRKGAPLLRLLVREFGIEIIQEDGSLNRKLLADLAFESQHGTRRLNELVQTAILVRALEYFNRMRLSKEYDLCFFDVPMLYEAGWDKYMDAVWLVTAPEDMRLKRVVERDKSRREEVLARMKLQMSEEEKIARADLILDNSGTESELRLRVQQALKELGELQAD